jgi:hypothetical protein
MSRIGVAILVVDDLSVGAEDAQVHELGMQIDPSVVSVLLCVESHPVSSFAPRWGLGLFGRSQRTLPVWQGGGLDEYQKLARDRAGSWFALAARRVKLCVRRQEGLT